MRTWQFAFLLVALASIGCGSHRDANTAGVEDSVREFAKTCALDVTREGPAAWRKHFADSPAFFLAANGHMVFPNSESATSGIQKLAQSIQRIELRWGTDLRVDPLTADLAVMASSYREVRLTTDGSRVDETGFFTGLAERRGGRWQFRDAHWSAAAPIVPAR